MKIRKPAPGRTTATLVAYKYCPRRKRTIPVRLGSFNITADPAALPRGVNLVEGAQLNFEDLAAIREFLLASPPVKFSAELVAQCRAEIEAEVRDEVSGQLEHQRTTEPQAALELVESIIRDAAGEVMATAKQLTLAGLRLTSQRSQLTAAPTGANALDVLQARANYVRRELLPAFEAACKEAGLMVKKAAQ